MSSNVRLFFNPACSKCRKSLTLLEEIHQPVEIVEYLASPPERDELESILGMLGLEPRELMRHNEAPYAELQLDNPALDRAQLIDAMLAHPVLIERPILIKDGRAVIGRPPERILDIL